MWQDKVATSVTLAACNSACRAAEIVINLEKNTLWSLLSHRWNDSQRGLLWGQFKQACMLTVKGNTIINSHNSSKAYGSRLVAWVIFVTWCASASGLYFSNWLTQRTSEMSSLKEQELACIVKHLYLFRLTIKRMAQSVFAVNPTVEADY